MVEQPTIYDVARAAGVAPSTVSRAFSRPGRVNSETAQRIRDVAEQLGYRVNPIARALSTQRTRMIALVVSDITNPFYFEIIRGAEEAAVAAGYTMILSDTQESDALERQALERAMPAVEGIVLASSRMSDSAIRMTAKQKPLIVLNRAITDVPSVVTDNARGARSALEHLAQLGHDAVTYVAGPEASYADGQRWRSLLEASHDLDVRVRRVGPNPPTVAEGVRAAGQLRLPANSAVIAYNDQLAIGLIRGFHSAGARVPRDVSVVGFDNVQFAGLVTPGLTTVAAPLKLMGATAVEHLLASMGSPRAGRRRPIVLPTQLVVRASTAHRKRTSRGRRG
jgi:LacI family repressor for deo operon, udp, cdd, tsx, nupC, and nupG